MSVNESSESADAVFQTPSSVVEELELAERQEEELGASPELSGPTTRSGRKRKNIVPVRSAGKKKNKMNTVRSPPNAAAPKAATSTGRTPRQNQKRLNHNEHRPKTLRRSLPLDCRLSRVP